MLGLRSFLKIVFAISVVTVVILSLLPLRSLPSTGVSDKLEHFVAYALLGLIAGCAFPTQRATILLIAFLSTLGIALELAQWFVPGRSPETFDAIASGVGVGTTLVPQLLLHSRLASQRASASIEPMLNSSGKSRQPKQPKDRQLDYH